MPLRHNGRNIIPYRLTVMRKGKRPLRIFFVFLVLTLAR